VVGVRVRVAPVVGVGVLVAPGTGVNVDVGVRVGVLAPIVAVAAGGSSKVKVNWLVPALPLLALTMKK